MKRFWNSKSNTIIIAIMIFIVAGIGNQVNRQDTVQSDMVADSSEAVAETENVIETMEVQAKQTVNLIGEEKNTPEEQVVRIIMKEHTGNGLVWEIDEEKMVIAANKHLLMEDTEGILRLENGKEVKMEIIGLSEQYDLGFARVMLNDMEEKDRSEIQSVLLPTFDAWKESTMLGQDIVQISKNANGESEQYEGYIWAYKFVAEFNENMLVTKCYARAGMSGGGIFSKEGILLGMIAGGELDSNVQERETELTYGISSVIIAQEYDRYR